MPYNSLSILFHTIDSYDYVIRFVIEAKRAQGSAGGKWSPIDATGSAAGALPVLIKVYLWETVSVLFLLFLWKREVNVYVISWFVIISAHERMYVQLNSYGKERRQKKGQIKRRSWASGFTLTPRNTSFWYRYFTPVRAGPSTASSQVLTPKKFASCHIITSGNLHGRFCLSLP